MTTRDPRRLRALADLSGEKPREWFHIGPVHAEVVGEQDNGDDKAETSADVYIFDRIGGWSGTTASSFVRDVAALDVDHLNVHLNSPGGDSADGVAIANVLRQHKADVTIWVDGLAASAASVIAMAGDEVVMGIGAQLMVHDAWAFAIGDAGEMRKAAEMLDSTSNAIAGTYAAKAGGTAAEWRVVMQTEAWYAGEEAVTAGLADRVATEADKGTAAGEQVVPGQAQPSFWDSWDSLSDADRHADVVRELYAYAGRADAPPPPMPGRQVVHIDGVDNRLTGRIQTALIGRRRETGTHQTPAASAGGSTSPQEDDDMSTLTEGLRQRLGFAESADEATILGALDEALAERATTEQPPRAALPEGAVAIDAGVLEQMRNDAAAGREAREQQQAERREQLVQAALRTGRITPVNADGWRNKLKVEGAAAEADLQSLAEGLVPVAETGHDQQPAAQGEDLSWFGPAPVPTTQER